MALAAAVSSIVGALKAAADLISSAADVEVALHMTIEGKEEILTAAKMAEMMSKEGAGA